MDVNARVKQFAKPAMARLWAFVALAVLFSLIILKNGGSANHAVNPADPVQIVRAYLRATYARDFAAAYRLISVEDRKVRDEDRYIRQRGAFNGFLLEAARKLGNSVEVEVLEQKAAGNRLYLRVRYTIPDSKAIAPILLNWDPYRLNMLNGAERAQLLAMLHRRQQEHSLEMTSGEEIFELTKEGNEWRVFLNWAAGVTIPFRLETPASGALSAAISNREINLQPGDVFEILLSVKNNTDQPIAARIGHLVEPRDAADYLDFVQCGFLLPVTIQAGKEQEYSGTYLLRGSLPERVKELKLTYDFKILE
jgi:hypothetical protein